MSAEYRSEHQSESTEAVVEIDDHVWGDIENVLGRNSHYSVLQYLHPENEAEERERFRAARAAGEWYEPSFEYPPIEHDTDRVDDRLGAAMNVLRALYRTAKEAAVPEDQRRNIDALVERTWKQQGYHEIVKRRDADPDTVKAVSAHIYRPRAEDVSTDRFLEELVPYAEHILRDHVVYPVEIPESDVTAEDVKTVADQAITRLNERLEADGADYTWSVEIDPARKTGYADSKRKTLVIGGDPERRYAPQDPYRFIVHELRHILGRENKYAELRDAAREGRRAEVKERLRHLQYDPATEEGITANLERITGTENPALIRRYALRALAVDAVYNHDMSFTETYDRLADPRFWGRDGEDVDEVWDATLRAHRGGGFVKDHIYLAGRMMVEDYLENGGGELKPLYIKKFGINQVDEAEEYLEQGLIEEPPFNQVDILDGILPEEQLDRLRQYWGGQ